MFTIKRVITAIVMILVSILIVFYVSALGWGLTSIGICLIITNAYIGAISALLDE